MEPHKMEPQMVWGSQYNTGYPESDSWESGE